MAFNIVKKCDCFYLSTFADSLSSLRAPDNCDHPFIQDILKSFSLLSVSEYDSCFSLG